MATRRNKAIEGTTEIEEREIWNQYEIIYLRQQKGADSDIHLYRDCMSFPNQDEYEPQEKEISVYPVGYKKVCLNCLYRWRQPDGE